MINKPDFVKKQIIVIESDNSKKIRFQNSNLIVSDENNKIIIQHPCSKIFIVFVIGEFSITSVLIKNAKKHGIYFSFLNYNLKSYFNIAPENKGNFLLRKKQYNCDVDFKISKMIVKNKIKNQLFLINSLRYKTELEKKGIDNIKNFIKKVELVSDFNELLGFEGNASKEFFKIYFKNTKFNGRKPRIKKDEINLLFDIGYFYLFNFIEANLEFYGFDVFQGFYHKLFYQRKSLVCDLIEPFRCIIDKKIKNGLNLKQIDFNDFYFSKGQYLIKKEYNKKYSQFFLEEILKYKEEIFLYIQSYYRCFIKNKDITSYPTFEIGEQK